MVEDFGVTTIGSIYSTSDKFGSFLSSVAEGAGLEVIGELIFGIDKFKTSVFPFST